MNLMTLVDTTNLETLTAEMCREINESRIRLGISPREVADCAGLPSAAIMEEFERGILPRSASELLNISSVLGVQLDRLIPIKNITLTQKDEIRTKMAALNFGDGRGNDGSVLLDDEIAVQLFLRFKVLAYLCEGGSADV